MRLIRSVFGVIAIVISMSAIVGAFTSQQAGRSGAVWLSSFIAFIFGWVGLKWLRPRNPTSWRADPATDKQKSYADSLGIRYRKGISKGELSDLISAETNEHEDEDEDD